MKRIWMIFISFISMVCFVVLFTAAAKAEDTAVMRFDFSYSINVRPFFTAIHFVPGTLGIEGDGFTISFDGKKYFLAEGQDLMLKNRFRYELAVNRVYNSPEGPVMGSGTSIKINAVKEEIGPELNLPAFEGKEYFLPAEVYIEVSTDSVEVFPEIYEGPSQVPADEIRVSFCPPPHSTTESITEILPGEGGKVTIPEGYWSCCVSKILEDEPNSRIIIASGNCIYVDN